ncbi:MAG: hypothetical protein HZA24_00315 [Nitrospirae bacterium]|nr:hypothetical protein [Nitrospirota bacterium]
MRGLRDAIQSACKRRRRIGIGAVEVTEKFRDSLREGACVADVIVVGAEVDGYECVPATGGEEATADQLIALAASGQVDGVVRGQLYYSYYHDAFREQFNIPRDVMCPCLIEDICGNEWFLTPVVQHDATSVAGRSYLATQAAKICEALGVEPVIGVLAADNERGYLRLVDQSLDDAEKISGMLRKRGYRSDIYPLRIDKAAFECNIVVPMDGTLGNFVCRTLGYLGGATLVGGFSLTRQIVSIDTSRANDRFGPAIEAAVAVSNLGGMPVEEYSEDLDGPF